MNLEKLARKLEPLRPEMVRYWRDARAFATTDVVALLDQELVRQARRVLGDPAHTLLLSLPPEQAARGQFQCGTVLYEQPKWPFGLRPPELLQGVAVFGRSGAGKTNVVFHLLLQLADARIPFLFLDVKRTVRHLLPKFARRPQFFTAGRSLSPLSFNPLLPPPGLEPHIYASIVVDTLASAYTLGDGAKSVLQRLLLTAYQRTLAPTPRELLAELERTPPHGRAIGWHASALRALQSLAMFDYGATAQTQADAIRLLVHGQTILELDSLNDNARAFLAPLLLLWIYHVLLAAREREQLSLVVIVEEAHHYFYRQERRAHESVMNRLLRQWRELGIGTIIVDQHAHLISAAALGNTFTTVALNQKDPADINKLAAMFSLDDEEKAWLSKLRVGVGIVKMQDRWRRPFLVRFPHVAHEKGAVTDEALSHLLTRIPRSPLAVRPMPISTGFGQVLPRDDPLSMDHLALIQDVLTHPDSGVKERYRRLGWNMERGTRAKHSLIRDGWFALEIVPVGMTRKHLLRLTEASERLLGVQTKRPMESLAHAYWKRWAAREWQHRGYRTIIEAPRPHPAPGTVDVLAINARETVAIEIETGKSRMVENVRNDLRAGYDRVVIIATDARAHNAIERGLLKAGLLLPPRVTIVDAHATGAKAA